jgi:hypothetical protein
VIAPLQLTSVRCNHRAKKLVHVCGPDADSENNWQSYMEVSNTMLVGEWFGCVSCGRALIRSLLTVVDVHKDWCGPCEVMLPTFRRIMLEMEMSDVRLMFVSVRMPVFCVPWLACTHLSPPFCAVLLCRS